jgi:hypothetical protein
MGKFRFQNLFALLMVIAFILTFLLPSRMSGKFRPQLGILFAPVSRPAAAAARMVGGRTQVVSAASDHRSDDTLREENEVLRGEVTRLRAVLDESQRRDKELANLGDISKFCVIAQVGGADTSGRDSITLIGRSLLNAKQGMYVLTHDGLVGKIDSVSAASAQVRLITDPGVRLRCRFTTFINGAPDYAPLPDVIVEGRGDGVMIVRRLKLYDLRLDNALQPLDPKAGPALKKDDYCILDDPDCPRQVQSWRVGKVEMISPSPGGRLMADVIIRPMVSLKRLPEAMVLNQER